jgi:hypothetical protein
MVSLVFLGAMPLKAHRYRKAPASGVRRTFRLNVVAQTPRRRDEGSPHGKGEKTSNPFLDTMSLARKNAFCNAFLKNTTFPPAIPNRTWLDPNLSLP